LYLIIVGGGKIGRDLVETASGEPNNIVVIESEEKKAKAISRDFDVSVLNADATSKEVLNEAGADRADALIATTSEDSVNLIVAFLGKELGIGELISVINDRGHRNIFFEIGVRVTQNLTRQTAQYLYNAVREPKIEQFINLAGGAQIFKIAVIEESYLAGERVGNPDEEDPFPPSLSLIAVEREDETIEIEGGEGIEIKAGDSLTFFSQKRASDRLLRHLRST